MDCALSLTWSGRAAENAGLLSDNIVRGLSGDFQKTPLSQTSAVVKGFRMPASRRREGRHGGKRPKSLEGGNRGGVRTGGGVRLWRFSAGV
jgi:hypothetical protein